MLCYMFPLDPHHRPLGPPIPSILYASTCSRAHQRLRVWITIRACAQPNRFLRCSRAVLAHLSEQRASPLLDVRFTTYNAEHDPYVRPAGRENPSGILPRPPSALTPAVHVPMEAHASSKFLVHLDGFTASTRLQQLLATGGAVLKQDSYFWE